MFVLFRHEEAVPKEVKKGWWEFGVFPALRGLVLYENWSVVCIDGGCMSHHLVRFAAVTASGQCFALEFESWW